MKNTALILVTLSSLLIANPVDDIDKQITTNAANIASVENGLAYYDTLVKRDNFGACERDIHGHKTLSELQAEAKKLNDQYVSLVNTHYELMDLRAAHSLANLR